MQPTPTRAQILFAQILEPIDETIASYFKLPERITSLGILSCDHEFVASTALDYATKQTNAEVVFSKTMYGNAAGIDTPIVGEFFGVLGARDRETIQEAIHFARAFIESEPGYSFANIDRSIPFYAKAVPSCGSFLAKKAGVSIGSPLAYLVAPPAFAFSALNAVLTSVSVYPGVFYTLPTTTNYGGAILTGSLQACEEACSVFSKEIVRTAKNPDQLKKHPKKEEYTTLLYDNVYAKKTHPVIIMRGKLDTFMASVLEAQLLAIRLNDSEMHEALQSLLLLIKDILKADSYNAPLLERPLLNMSEAEIHELSHNPSKFGLDGHIFLPSVSYGEAFIALNKLRAQIRECELAAISAYENRLEERSDILRALNRASSLLYILCMKRAK